MSAIPEVPQDAFMQSRPTLDSGLVSLLMMAQLHGLPADENQLRHEFGTDGPFDTTAVLLAARKIGMTGKCIRQDPERLDKAPLPAIALDTEGRFFILARVDAGLGGNTATPGKVPGAKDCRPLTSWAIITGTAIRIRDYR